MQKTVYYSTSNQPGAPAKASQPAASRRRAAPRRAVAPMAAAAQPGVATAATHRRTRRGLKTAPMVLIACLMLALLAVLLVPLLVGGASAPSSQPVPQAQAAPSAAAVSYTTVQQATQKLDIQPAMPAALPDGYEATAVNAIDEQVIEVVYSNGSSPVVLRTAAGSDDLSDGALTAYLYTANETADGVARSYAGVSEKKLNLAVWAHGGYSYAITAADGLDAEEMRKLAESVQ